jgi:hypothetical protein
MAEQPALKDRMVFFVVAACAATAGATWVVSENVRVKPLAAELERTGVRMKALLDKEAARSMAAPSAPVITDITLARLRNDTGYDIEQNIYFKDPEGDATFISFVVLGTSAETLKVTSHAVHQPADQQIKGGVVKRTWTCGRGAYFVKLRAYVTDASGNVSRPRDYTLNC